MSKFYRSFFWGIFLPLLGFSACTCSNEQAIQQVLGASAETPVFLGVKAVSAREVLFEFSQAVSVSALNFDPPLEIESISEGNSVQVQLKAAMHGGERIMADILVEDERGNTLGVLIPFRSKNDRIPKLVITELRTEYANPKAEFVEFRTLSAGNLGALRLFIAGAGMAEPVFEFPPAEVAAGEYLVLHLRTIDPASVNETGSDRGLSPGTEAFPEARDFWVSGAVKRLRKTDAVLLLDQDDKVLDGVLLSENPDAAWAKDDLSRAAEILGSQGAWTGPAGEKLKKPAPRDAFLSKGTTATRTICREEASADSNSPQDWYICDSSQASPGKPNSDKRYQPKP